MIRKLLRYRIRRLRAVSARARLDLLWAQVALIRALLLVRFRRRGLLVKPEDADPSPPVPADGALVPRARELALAVRRVAEHGIVRATCLPRALATLWLLQREGAVGASVRVGVRMRDGRFGAHAWVEYAGVQLVDSEAELTDLRQMEGLVVGRGS